MASLAWQSHVRNVNTKLAWQFAPADDGTITLSSRTGEKILARPLGKNTKIEWSVPRGLYTIPTTPTILPEPDNTFGVKRNLSIARPADNVVDELKKHGILDAATRAAQYAAAVTRNVNDLNAITKRVTTSIAAADPECSIAYTHSDGITTGIITTRRGYSTSTIQVNGSEATINNLTVSPTTAHDIITIVTNTSL